MLRFYNGKIMSFENGLKLTDDELWTDGGIISYIGPSRADAPVFEREIDLKGDVLMPGFKNAHTHTGMTFLRSAADDLPLHQWLNEEIFPREARLTDEAVYYFTKLGIMEYLSTGVTANFDMYYRNDYYTAACRDSGFRTVMCSSMNNYDKDPENIEREFLKFHSADGMTGYTLGLHAEYTTSLERIEYMVSLIEKYKAPAFIHLEETKSETEDCIKRYGMTPAAFLSSIGFFKYGGGGFHCVWFTDEDIELFARKGLYVVTCPASNLKLASGIAPITRMQKAGINIAIGTDGPSSNNALDMFREMYLVTVLQKYACNDAAACPAEDVLEMACVNGAKCIGLDDCSDLQVGKKADMIVIDLNRPNMQPVLNIPKNLVYSGSKENVRMTVINGKILYENGEFYIGESAEDVYKNCAEILKKIS